MPCRNRLQVIQCLFLIFETLIGFARTALIDLGYLLGIDLGTTGCKTMLFDSSGRRMSSSYTEYPLYTLNDAMVEQDPEDWWKATCVTVRRTLKEARVSAKDVMAVGCSGQFPGLVMLDKGGKPVRRAIIYSDMRAEKQSEQIFDTIGSKKVRELTGLPKSYFPGLPVAKILWVRQNESRVEKKTFRVFGAKDFLNYRLTGCAAVDHVEAWWTGLVTVRDYSWSDKIFKTLRIDRGWFGDIVEPSDIIGEVTEKASKETGLAKSTPVVCGSADGMCNVIGSGITQPGDTMDASGATEIIASLSNKRLPPSLSESIFCWRHLDPENWIVYASTATACACLRWFRDQFADAEKRDAVQAGLSVYEILDREAADAGAGAGELLFLPYLAGEYAPFFDLDARGVFLGITLDKKRKHFVRAILEGVAYSLRHVIESFNSLGVETRVIRVGGGGSRSGLWNQIKADVTGNMVQSMGVPEIGCLGAAILAGIGIGVYSSYREAARSTISIQESFLPNQKNHELYSKLFTVYKETYKHLGSIFTRLPRS